MNETTLQNTTNTNSAKWIYIFYLVSLTGIGGLFGLIGLIMAYINRSDAPDWLKSHYQFQIRTFWIGILLTIIGGILLVVFIGLIVYLYLIIWWIIRCVKGMKLLEKQQAIENPTTWGFSVR